MEAALAKNKNLFISILVTGLLAGTLDIIAAILSSGASPTRVFQFIASGAFGREDAFAGGAVMVAWGVFFHYLIAFSWTILFFVLYPKIMVLQKNKIVVGLAYGIVIWVVMNLLILPMSQIVQRPFNLTQALIGTAILMVMVGLPISIMANRHYSR